MLTPSPTPPFMLRASGLVVDFPGVRALDHVDFEVRAGEVHALLGENGAGKSTLIRVLSGLSHSASLVQGSVTIAGVHADISSPVKAARAGISTVHQEVDLVPTMSVADNIGMGRFPTATGLIRTRAMHARARAALARVGVRIDPSSVLREHSIATQQLVAIARALDTDARFLILDEPTSSLDAREVLSLFEVLGSLVSRGIGIVFVTHFLDQVYRISARITVLRNGSRVGTWDARDLPRTALVEAMTGRLASPARVPSPENSRASRPQSPVDSTPPVLSFTNLGRARAISPCSSRVDPGEALGLAGLLGSGRSELARLVFGADRSERRAGEEIRVRGARVRQGSIQDSIAHGMAMTPEDRKALGLVLELSVRENILLALQARRGALRPIAQIEQSRLTLHYISALRISTPNPDSPVGSLSGGNQQKVLLARWLAMNPTLLILDEPTRGIDVGARAEIESLLADLITQGLAVLLVSAELDELVRLCGRVLVLRDHAVVGELAGEHVTEGEIVSRIGAGGTREVPT